MEKSTNLSVIQILITLILFFGWPYVATLLAGQLENFTIAATFTIHTITLILVVMNFHVFELHYRRIQNKKKETLLFIVVGFILSCAVTIINELFSKGFIFTPELATLKQYSFFYITIILAYTLCYAICFGITFKCFTDRFKVRIGEKAVILGSGLLFGFFVAITQQGLEWPLLLYSFGYNFLISLITAYLYNQTNSILPMIISFSLTLFLNILL